MLQKKSGFSASFLHLLFIFQGASILQAQALLDYIYCGKVELMKEELEDFIKMAIDLQVRGILDYKDSLATLEEDTNGEILIQLKQILHF